MVYSVQGQDIQKSYQAGMDARFAVARRHSRHVRLLRKAVPVMVVMSMLAIVGISIFNPFRILGKLPIDISNLAVSGTKITMESPHLAGFTPDRRPYELWAKAATQDVTDPTKVEMHELRAQIQMEDKSTTTLVSRLGRFDTKAQVLDLFDDIVLRTSTGYEAHLSQAHVDMASGTITSDNAVSMISKSGTLDAKTMKISDNGAVALFDNGVSMLLKTDDSSKAEAAVPNAAAGSQ